MANKKILQILEEVESIIDQMNNLSYNNKEERQLLEAHESRLDLIYDDLEGKHEAQIKRKKNNSQPLKFH